MTNTPLISKVKYHSLDDGPGIRSVVFFKGCPLNCWWCHNPEAIDPRAELSLEERCMADCSKPCISACPHNAISFADAAVQVDRESCDLCEACLPACDYGVISKVGESIPVGKLTEQLIKYQPFFTNSGGGVTLSGGEATLYAGYCGELLQQLKACDVHTLLETCGFFHFDRVARHMLPYLDSVYFDLKLADTRLHERYCGQGNQTIFTNFQKLLEHQQAYNYTLLPRIPLIPNITTTSENLTAIADFLKQCHVNQVALLPYNPLWMSKAAKIGETVKYAHDQWLSDNLLQQCEEIFAGFTLV